ncbi:4'-phosphopantetheinyl transferase superfamily protein [Bifidobacterium sp. 64T4]|uniref:holo-ACP synthase n=1 Tax=Bifidobacterium pongonis TaxID=2834432 RepID=UPI001C599707|nr:4'-phosphopantetheinyl transferase superfamily protein [Bifidobacterium pongonis]MBW3094462.1 4'-phosphopantetheinyl transferase superfamily protein [Bifidobacterium pongonis]
MELMGLGHDVVDVTAFARQLGEPGSRMRGLFSARELRQTAQRARVKNDGEAVHLAARWAGKEAVLKAWCEAIAQLPSGVAARAGAGDYPYTIDDFPWREVEILDDSHGCPRVALSDAVTEAVRRSLGCAGGNGGVDADARVFAFHISLTHDGPIASAMAMLRVCDE